MLPIPCYQFCYFRNMTLTFIKWHLRMQYVFLYSWHPPHLLVKYVCGNLFTVNHDISCPFNGLPTQRYNEIHDLTDRLDIDASSIWSWAEKRAFFYVRVLNPFAHSHCRLSLTACYRINKPEKKQSRTQRTNVVEHR